MATDYQRCAELDEEQCLLTSEFPRCPRCQAIARPNILMFGDWRWLSDRSDAQERRLRAWLRPLERPLVIAVGAGTSIPTVRRMGERLPGPMIRINPREPQLAASRGVSIADSGLRALRAIEACLR